MGEEKKKKAYVAPEEISLMLPLKSIKSEPLQH